MMSDLRLRKAPESNQNISSHENQNGYSRRVENIELFTGIHWLIITLYIACVFALCFWADGILPEPLSSEQAEPGQFSEGRARKYLEAMDEFGPKPSGSYEAEVLTRNYILDELNRIKSVAKNQHTIEIDIQKPSDCYELFFLSHYISCYKNITNIAVRLSPSHTKKHFGVLVNCHFDSAVSSPGATDDLAACSVMLEILYVLSQSDKPLKHSIVFLFNGAEENFLQGSHAFITQHPWRYGLQAFINMEGAGAGGREFLFQSGPANTWLLHAYIDNAPYPHGSILAQEVFESGVLISDTDFRVFRDHGRLSGLDLAFTRNSYLYHTELDNAAHIAPGSLQRLGANVLATLRVVANSPCLETPCPALDNKVVFFDVLGIAVIQYPRYVATPLNLLMCLLVVLKIVVAVRSAKRGLSTENCYSVNDFVWQLAFTLASLLAAVAVIFAMCVVVNFTGLTMSWYSRWLLVLPLYIWPSTIAGMAVHVFLAAGRRRVLRSVHLFHAEALHYDTILSIFACTLFVITSLGIQSTYFVLIHLIFPLLRDPVILFLNRLFKLERTANVIYFTQLTLLVPVTIIGSYAFVEVIHVFIPLVGRAGSALNPELLIAAVCLSVSVSFVLHLSNLVYISNSVKKLLKRAVLLNLMFFWIMCLPGVIRPFQFSVEAPTWRRLHAQHVRRRIFASVSDPAPLEDESALWIAPMDYRGTGDLPPQLAPSPSSMTPNCARARDAFCSLPYYVPARKVVAPKDTLWLPTPGQSPTFERPTSITLGRKIYIRGDRVRLNLTIDGSDHISVYLTPLSPWILEYFVFESNVIRNVDPSQGTHFLYLASVQPVGPWTFTVALHAKSFAPENEERGVVLYIAAASHEMHGAHWHSAKLRELNAEILAKRQKSHPRHNWRWAMTMNGFSSDYLGTYV